MKNVILGTDWWTDCDDVVAIRVLSTLHKQGIVRLLGVAMSGCMADSVRSLDGFLRDSGIEVPVGIDLTADYFGGNPPYQRRLANLPSVYRDNTEAENPVKLYRRLLENATDPVELIEIGYPQILTALMRSSADAVSPLDGMALIRNKVSHLWIMAGKWDEPRGGRENNFCRTRQTSESAAELCDKWPTAITFLGWEIGASVISGGHLPAEDPLRYALLDHGSPHGRSSWDPMLILLAAAGHPEEAGYRCVRGQARVEPEHGGNYFVESPDGTHCYVIKTRVDEYYADQIDAML